MPRPSDHVQPQSTALVANLEETRSEVVIPADYRPLLASVDQLYGVRQVAEKLLTELYHPLRNVAEIQGHLGNLCGGMFHYFERSDHRDRSAHLINRVFGELYDSEPDQDAVAGLVGIHLQFLETMGRSRYASGYLPVIRSGLKRLNELQAARGAAFLRHSRLARRLAQNSQGRDGVGTRFADLYAGLVDLGLTVFDQSVALEKWCWSEPVGTAAEVLAVVAGPLTEAIGMTRSRRAAATGSSELVGLPNLDDLLDMVLRRARELPSPIERIALYVHLAGVDELQHRNLEILRALYQAIRTVCSSGDDEAIIRAVDLITGHLAVCAPSHKPLLYRCLEKLGQGIATRGSGTVIAHFVDRTIAIGFDGPDIRGVSEEWQTFVNPHHLPCLRTWLSIIETDPIACEQLLSALVINLHLEGVFVSDTDLFQRDVSALLNSGIADAFNLIMQLLAYFPVFFNEVGSEGELREVSTRIDQLTHRRDPIIHYLRKQCHAESNNRLVGFTAAVWGCWRTGNLAGVAQYLPDSTFARLSVDADWFCGVHRIAGWLEGTGITEADLDELDVTELVAAVADIPDVDEVDRERVALLARMYQLLRAKYTYSSSEIVATVELSPLVRSETRERFARTCSGGDDLEIVAAGHRVLEELKAIITDPEPTESFESIFHKRHIAAGIPSMYGTYREPKFDAMGLMLRLMAFLKPRLEARVASFDHQTVTWSSIKEAHRIMVEMLAGLRVSGLRVRHLASKLELLDRAIARGDLSARQVLNILDLSSEALNDVVDTNYISLHVKNLERMAGRPARGGDHATGGTEGDSGSWSERFLRDRIASTYAIQELDLLLRRLRQGLRRSASGLAGSAPRAPSDRAVFRQISFIGGPAAVHEDQIGLGYKGHSLKRLRALGLRVPDGFVVPTDLLASTVDDGGLAEDVQREIRDAICRLEEITALRLGDPHRPLLLSARSGAAFSMPGMMDTILNIGLNRTLLGEMSGSPEARWGAWDCYRRYLQNVAMSCGVDRDVFDEMMVRFKERHRVERKLEFTPLQMQKIALAYREVGSEQGVEFEDEPVEQLMQAVALVARSWDGEPARLFRNQLQLAPEWGTAVIVQQMVFGNMNPTSGSGVVFTRNPRASTTGIGLFGDFTMCSQGEDVVAGLVHPFPVSEVQRIEYSPHLSLSLETEFPEIYRELKRIAASLINDHLYEHQEIEFTFCSGEARDLHILQNRPMRLLRQARVPVFADPAAMEDRVIGAGIGVSGGALSGVVAFDSGDVRRLRSAEPELAVILLRPDTVPEDIGLVVSVDGLLTARGGFTSHAAVTAKHLGKCCVVNCTNLEVDDSSGVARIGGHALLAGDRIAIDGLSGGVYLGEHRVAEVGGAGRLK